ncbi:MAG: EamA family transporter [Saprospiraceae bacterium]|nr:EamA family transporter [Saprospiraceae bacterium]MCB9325513.1 EamA family transporter [Lewinellaceae bacterium]
MHWIFPAIMTAVFFGAYNVFIKLASGHINQIVGAVILQVVAALLGGLILLILKTTDQPLEISQKGINYALLAGVFVGLAEITSFYVFSKGISASVGIPIIIGGSVLVGAILGLTFLKESLGPVQYFAIALIVTGVVLLSVR